ncbi:hypothetical protein FAZ15_01385 [Sphingobacterium olei]|uniref:Uncharacterized protein n=1 Tax=Sphingobacterium olei TaxID=2571155 RepID=A0A4U0P6R1_9SPHI|nr:hypothetical protein [Sphingobacterium olei]TJZ62980.1 hypothetical protein FAZ15_01385 [Sphingobacterium olei]
MFEKFQLAVRNAYLDLKKNNKLRFDREWPSPGELKDWCLVVYSKGISKDDETIFTRFFNRDNSDDTIETSIRNIDLDRLRPLRNFIIGETNRRPDENLVKLLAILIDFSPRPYRLQDWIIDQNPENSDVNIDNKIGDKNDQDEHNILSDELTKNEINTDLEKGGLTSTEDGRQTVEKEVIGIVEEEEFNNVEEIKGKDTAEKESSFVKPASFFKPTTPIPPKQNRRIFYQTGAVLAAIGLSIAIYLLPQNQCMCWQEDHYVAVDCEEKILGTEVIALDADKLKYFEKINRPDTLTKEHVNRVWYSKINNQVEFFTGPGMHPVHDHRSLKAATIHIIESYALNDTTANDLVRD